MAKKTEAAKEERQPRSPRDATAGGGPPVNGDHFAGDMRARSNGRFSGPEG